MNRKMGEKMKKRKVSIGGLVVAIVIFLIFLKQFSLLLTGKFPKEVPLVMQIGTVEMWLVPALAMLLRAFRPPMGFRKGLETFFGGTLTGMGIIPLSAAISGSQIAAGFFITALIFFSLGFFLLRLGFKVPVQHSDIQEKDNQIEEGSHSEVINNENALGDKSKINI